jgi:hypothetical protein
METSTDDTVGLEIVLARRSLVLPRMSHGSSVDEYFIEKVLMCSMDKKIFDDVTPEAVTIRLFLREFHRIR